jgi:hypothetical protein
MEEILEKANSETEKPEKRKVGRPRKDTSKDLFRDLDKIGEAVKSQVNNIETDLKNVLKEQEQFKSYLFEVEQYTKESETYHKAISKQFEDLEKKVDLNVDKLNIIEKHLSTIITIIKMNIETMKTQDDQIKALSKIKYGR